MLLSEAIDYVSYFMDIKKADGAFAEAWSIIFKELAEGQKPTTNITRAERVRRNGRGTIREAARDNQRSLRKV